MPFVENQGAKIYWDEQGQGEPILLIMGLGWPATITTVPSLSTIAAPAAATCPPGRTPSPPWPRMRPPCLTPPE